MRKLLTLVALAWAGGTSTAGAQPPNNLHYYYPVPAAKPPQGRKAPEAKDKASAPAGTAAEPARAEPTADALAQSEPGRAGEGARSTMVAIAPTTPSIALCSSSALTAAITAADSTRPACRRMAETTSTRMIAACPQG